MKITISFLELKHDKALSTLVKSDHPMMKATSQQKNQTSGRPKSAWNQDRYFKTKKRGFPSYIIAFTKNPYTLVIDLIGVT